MRRMFVDINFQLGDSIVFYIYNKNDLITIKINHDGCFYVSPNNNFLSGHLTSFLQDYQGGWRKWYHTFIEHIYWSTSPKGGIIEVSETKLITWKYSLEDCDNFCNCSISRHLEDMRQKGGKSRPSKISKGCSFQIVLPILPILQNLQRHRRLLYQKPGNIFMRRMFVVLNFQWGDSAV